jgi:TRAP-type C4-dicarboxylate transport system permease small subunit
MLNTILKWVTNILAFLSIVCFAGILVTVTMQILSRFLPFSYVWTEELTRYFFLFAICFGAPLALLRNEYINVDLIVGRLSKVVRRFYDIGIYLVIFILSIIMTKEGYAFMLLGKTQKSATMPFQMSLIHASMFWMSLFLAAFCLVRIWFLIRNVKNEYEVEGGGEI